MVGDFIEINRAIVLLFFLPLQSDLSLSLSLSVSLCIEFWARLGIDGIFLDGLERFAFGKDDWVPTRVANWENVFEKYGTTDNKRILMTSYKFAKHLTEADTDNRKDALKHIGT